MYFLKTVGIILGSINIFMATFMATGQASLTPEDQPTIPRNRALLPSDLAGDFHNPQIKPAEKNSAPCPEAGSEKTLVKDSSALLKKVREGLIKMCKQYRKEDDDDDFKRTLILLTNDQIELLKKKDKMAASEQMDVRFSKVLQQLKDWGVLTAVIRQSWAVVLKWKNIFTQDDGTKSNEESDEIAEGKVREAMKVIQDWWEIPNLKKGTLQTMTITMEGVSHRPWDAQALHFVAKLHANKVLNDAHQSTLLKFFNARNAFAPGREGVYECLEKLGLKETKIFSVKADEFTGAICPGRLDFEVRGLVNALFTDSRIYFRKARLLKILQAHSFLIEESTESMFQKILNALMIDPIFHKKAIRCLNQELSNLQKLDEELKYNKSVLSKKLKYKKSVAPDEYYPTYRKFF